MLKRIEVLIAAAALAALLGGCGGGAATSGPGAVAVPFTAFSALGANQTVEAQGVSATASGNRSVGTGGAVTITSANRSAFDTDASSGVLTFENSELAAMRFNSPGSVVGFDRRVGQSLQCAGDLCGAESPAGEADALLANARASALGWNYQTFGIWARRPTATTWQTGAMSMGNVTPGSAVPGTGSAVFTGRAMGFYADANGTPYTTFADMRADVTFGAQPSIAFSTSNTSLFNQNTAATSSGSGLNLSGTLTYNRGIGQFSGAVSNTRMNGQASGRFYGPGAEEIGGVYSLGVPGSREHMIGGFGGKR